jgi:transcriptional regulator with XRE-family HTH domain
MYPNLKLRLWTRGIRQNRLAKMIEIDETTLSKIVNGFRQPTPEIRGRIAAALESDEDWLFQKIMEASAPPEVIRQEQVIRQEHNGAPARGARRSRASVSV